MKRTKAEAEETKATLLDAALKVFGEKGYQAARLQDIANEAGTTRGAVYHHFGNKFGLYKALLEEAGAQGNDVIQKSIAAGGSFEEIMRRVMVTSLKLIEENQRYRQVAKLQLFKTGMSDELKEIDAQRRSEAITTVDSVAGMLAGGIESGALRSDLSPHTLARAFLAYQNGLIWLWLLNEDAFSLVGEAELLAESLFGGFLKK